MSHSSFVIEHYAVITALAALAYLIGSRLTRAADYHSAAEKISICVALGLGIISHFVFAAGLLHLLTKGAMLAVLVIVAVICYPGWQVTHAAMIRLRQRVTRRHLVLTIIGVAAALPVLMLPLFPPTNWDAVSYHLAAAKIYASESAVVYTPYLRFPVFPQ